MKRRIVGTRLGIDNWMPKWCSGYEIPQMHGPRRNNSWTGYDGDTANRTFEHDSRRDFERKGTMTQCFFVLEPFPKGKYDSARTDVMETEGANVGEAPKCPSCGRAIGMLKWLPPYRVEMDAWGDHFGDFAFVGGCEWFLVSDRFRSIYVRSGLKGLSGFDPVEVRKITRHNKKLRGNPPQYFKVDVVRSQTAVDPAASGFEWSEGTSICPVCLFPKEGVIKRWSGIVIRPESWQGEDIFVPRGGGELVTTSRFKDLCEANEVKNAVFLLAESYGHDYYPWEQQRQSVL
jgi:hypothetical protein